jgi:hypothetical protein
MLQGVGPRYTLHGHKLIVLGGEREKGKGKRGKGKGERAKKYTPDFPD